MHFQPLPPHCLWMLTRSLTPQPTGWRYHSIWFAMCGDVFYKNFYVSFWVFIFSNLCDKFAIASHKHTQRITVHASQWRVESLWCVCVCALDRSRSSFGFLHFNTPIGPWNMFNMRKICVKQITNDPYTMCRKSERRSTTFPRFIANVENTDWTYDPVGYCL